MMTAEQQKTISSICRKHRGEHFAFLVERLLDEKETTLLASLGVVVTFDSDGSVNIFIREKAKTYGAC